MTKILSVFAFVSAVTGSMAANAELKFKSQKEKSYYAQVVEWYKTGTPVKFEDVKGYHRGTCFVFFKPNRGHDAVLGVDEIQKFGPAFPAKKILGNIWSSPGAKLENLKNTLRGWDANLTMIDETATDLTNNWDMEANGRADWSQSVRRQGEYLVLITTELIGQGYHSNVYDEDYTAKKGQIVDACYLYQAITE